ncbi:MAG: ABC transporter permease [Acidobacteria bacterium]|nr:ABC transporter permease [Acidobacteriota bacterium]
MKIGHIASNTFKESVREKVLYNLLLFALLMIASSLVLSEISIGQERKIIIDLGLSAVSLFGTMIAIFIGIGLVYKEIDKRTIYSLLAKPIHRWEFILGKYLGLLFTLLVNVAVMTAAIYAALFYLERGLQWSHGLILWAVLLIFFELALTTSLALMFSSFSTPLLSAAFTFFLWIIGHFNADLKHFGNLTESSFVSGLCDVLYYLLPNYGNFNIIQPVAHLEPVTASFVGTSVAYGLLYVALVLGCSLIIFQHRNFK